MSRTQAGTGKTVTAVMGEDGRVYFEYVPKPVRARAPLRLPDWMSVALSFLVAAVVAAAALLI